MNGQFGKNTNNASIGSGAFPLISAVIPSFNQSDFIAKSIDSILGQDYPRLEIIVVDGGSTDRTLEILKSYGNQIRWISEKDRGQTDALNKGFHMAKGEIIAWLNTDDLYDEGCLQTVGSYFQNHPDCLWLYGRCVIIDAEGREIRKWVTAYKNFFCRRYSHNSLLIQNFVSQMGVFFRKRVFLEIGELDVSLRNAMDYDYWLRIAARYRPHFIDRNLGKFRLHPGSKTLKETSNLFGNDYLCAKKYAKGKPWIIFLHKIFHISILCYYSLFGLLARLTGK
ncbi:MAG TPA: glycosyltransferase family 2 protein [Candidatus Omnitrophota bacterium]|nr:glycosyltransferase family 2 protein [Candidatus Omnitrophota bacterium]